MKTKILLLIYWVVAVGCKEVSDDNVRFTLLDAKKSGIDFINKIDPKQTNILDYVNLYNGAGVGVGDFNNDGHEDIVLAGNMVSSRIYLNRGEPGKISFEELTDSGIENTSWANGITVVDLNQDGWQDIYLSVSNGKTGIERGNLLYINLGADENGTPKFEEQSKKYNLNDTTHTIQSTFFDYDLDGDLDVFMIVNYPSGYLSAESNRIVTIKKVGDPNQSDRLYRNDGNGSDGYPVFTDVSSEAGITLEGFSLGLAVSDFDHNGFPDLYIANDYISNDIIYMNNGDGTFTDRIREYVKHTSYSSMGVDIADINNDGWQDVMVLDMLPEADDKMKMMYPASHNNKSDYMRKSNYVDQYFRNTLQLNNGFNADHQLSFSEIGQMSGVFRTNWSWSTLMADFDLDGWRDIFVTNGFSKDVNDLDFINYQPASPFENKSFDGDAYVESLETQEGIFLPNYIYQNQGDLTFKDQSKSWGFTKPSYSNGAAYGDFDNDGDLDLVINNVNDVAFFYENKSSSYSDSGNYLKVKLEGEAPNLQAFGTRINFETSSGIQSYEHFPTRGFMSSMSQVAFFGIGVDSTVSKIEVIWPDGDQQTISNVKANQTLVIKKGGSQPKIDLTQTEQIAESGIFQKSKVSGLSYKHQEESYNDFDQQVLLSHKLSQYGPSIAVGDVDQNGADDFYIGGAKGSKGTLFFQEENGSFNEIFIEDQKQYEDQGSLLFDADGDGDLDLYVVSGGVEFGKESRYYKDRLYLNEGERKLNQSSIDLPSSNGSCVIATDYDKDGDLDLFIGGRSLPNQYPLPSGSHLLRNDTKKIGNPVFTDITSKLISYPASLGIVNSAIWSDYDNDGWTDLLIVGEFMPVTIFRNNKGQLQKQEENGLNDYLGLWNSINGADVDQDGDIDYVVGNLGLNTRYKPTKEEPIIVYTADYDENGEIDPVMTQFRDGKEVPVHLRDDMFQQMISLKKKMPKYSEYMNAEIHDLIPRNILENALKLQCNYLQSALLLNKGDGKFEVQPLPPHAQFAPVYGTLIRDFTNDGYPDILTVGNSFASESFSGWYDASIGSLLEGSGQGNFNTLPLGKSNFHVNADAKALTELVNSKNELLTLISANNDSLQVFSRTEQSGKLIRLNHDDQWAELIYNDGRKERIEFYYGHGYLSQSSRVLTIHKDVESVKITNTKGNQRTIDQRI